MADSTEVHVPDIGDFDAVEVIEVLVGAGQQVAAEDPLITLESDKATMDIPAPRAGTVEKLLVKVGQKVSKGTPILMLAGGEAQPTAAEKKTEEAPAPAPAPAKAPQGDAKKQTPAEPTPPAPAAASETAEVVVPDIGDFDAVDVIEVLVSAGQQVAAEDPLITLESDKATMDIPAPRAGAVEKLLVKVGQKVSKGTPILTLTGGAAAPAAAEKTAPAPTPAKTDAPAPAQPAAAKTEAQRPPPLPHPSQLQRTGEAPHASPAVRRFARELGADLARMRGSGPKGRILKTDVQAWVKQQLSAAPSAGAGGIPPLPVVDFSKFGAVETAPLSRIKKLSGPHLQRAWLNMPHVTHHDDADITELEAFRQSLKAEAEKDGVRITLLGFAIKALAQALKKFPAFNSSLHPDGESLILKKYYNIGIAVDTPNGLVVPVIRDAERKSISELAREMGDLSARARDNKLKSEDLQGGCMTISSLGGIGGASFTPIINAPEVAILGITRARMTPVWDGSAFQPRLLLPLDLSYDHRVIDGAEAARFTAYLVKVFGDVRRLSL
ncbi:MAG: dihydrolipoyllysine-residue acetyltransferase [Gammaproteobacteria bacterium]|nr:dihydrolipoyllysine-residue acetyltransferase [Gammaproteobacteria bacterium]MDA7969810.1 dihydrolipoyllysine-residue acetyltransferase [Gammaproteobacteria bacterium]